MPGIAMHGTAPIFYRIPVSPQLLEALATSTYPKEGDLLLLWYVLLGQPTCYSAMLRSFQSLSGIFTFILTNSLYLTHLDAECNGGTRE